MPSFRLLRVAPRRVAVLLVFLLSSAALLVGGPAGPSCAHAQGRPVPDVAVLTGWPESLPQLLREMGTRAPRLLPEIDSLALEYTYTPGPDDVVWELQFSWRPGRRVLYEGRVLPRRDAPSGLRMVSIEVLADVIVDGQRRAEMVVAVDSMRLGPQPRVYRFEALAGYNRVFLDTPPDAARRFLERGVTLANLRIERMGFVAEEEDGVTGAMRPPDTRERRPVPRRAPSVYEPRTRVGVLIGWRIGPDPYFVGPGGRDRGARTRTDRPRSQGSGRTPTAGNDTPPRGSSRGDRDTDRADRERAENGDASEGRSTSDAERGTGSRTSDGDASGGDEDDDGGDDDDLLGPALIAAGAVGAAAIIGGTAGVFGTGDTPIGLAAGYTQARGGIQLQAAINSAVLDDNGTQRLTIKAMGFYDAFDAPVQPALGIGAQAQAIGETTTLDPSVSVGAVGRIGPVLLYGGFDVAQGAPEVGLAINFRSGGH